MKRQFKFGKKSIEIEWFRRNTSKKTKNFGMVKSLQTRCKMTINGNSISKKICKYYQDEDNSALAKRLTLTKVIKEFPSLTKSQRSKIWKNVLLINK